MTGAALRQLQGAAARAASIRASTTGSRGEIADDVLHYGDVRRALRDLMQRGMQTADGRIPGLRDLLDPKRSLLP